MSQQFDFNGPSALSVVFYAGLQGAQMVELTARQAYVRATAVTGAVVERAQMRLTLDEFLELLERPDIREAAEMRK